MPLDKSVLKTNTSVQVDKIERIIELVSLEE
jgi:hypothetical protein